MSPQNHQKGNLMFTFAKSDIMYFIQSQSTNRHKVLGQSAINLPTCAKEGKHMGNTSSGTKLNNTYHDTRTHYLMEQEPSQIQDQAEGDGCCCYTDHSYKNRTGTGKTGRSDRFRTEPVFFFANEGILFLKKS
jgi:hypothetical protein